MQGWRMVEIDDGLNLLELPDVKENQVQLLNRADFNDENDWPNQCKWFMNNLEKFSKFFRPKIKSM